MLPVHRLKSLAHTCILLLICSVSFNSLAAPDSTIKWAMSVPASIFDVGMLRMNDLLVFSKPDGVERVLARYSKEENQIFIKMVDVSEKKEANRSRCKGLLEDIRVKGEVSREGLPLDKTYGSLYAQSFGHQGDQIYGVNQGVDKIIELQAWVGPPGEQIRCHGPLLSNHVFYEE